MKRKLYCLAFVVTAAILLSSLLTNLAFCDEPLVDSAVTLGPEYSNSSRYWWIYNVTGGSTLSINIAVLNGTHVDFYIKRGTNGERVYDKSDLQALQDNWVVPDTGDYICNLDNSNYGYRTSEVSILIQTTAAQGGGGGFDPAPIVVVVIVLLVLLVSVFLIVRMRKQPPLPPPPEEPPPPPA